MASPRVVPSHDRNHWVRYTPLSASCTGDAAASDRLRFLSLSKARDYTSAARANCVQEVHRGRRTSRPGDGRPGSRAGRRGQHPDVREEVAGTPFRPEEVGLATRNHGMPLEALRYDVTPPGLHYLLIHFDVPEVDAENWRLESRGSWGARSP